jgi:hypothetical protein
MIDIVFMTEFTGLNVSYITDFDGLRELGEEKMSDLVTWLNGTGATSGGAPGPGRKCCASRITESAIFLFILSAIIMHI